MTGSSATGAWVGSEAPAGTAVAAGHHDERFRHEVLAVVLRVRGKSLEVLLWQRGAPPFEGTWSLPGGPLGPSERLGTSAGRHLATKVDLTVIAHLEQLETRSDPERDPRGRVLATAYLALVSADVEPRIPADTAWHAAADLPPTAFDHGSIVGSATERLRAKLSYTNHPRCRPADRAGRKAGHPLPVRGPDPGGHQPLRRLPPADPGQPRQPRWAVPDRTPERRRQSAGQLAGRSYRTVGRRATGVGRPMILNPAQPRLLRDRHSSRLPGAARTADRPHRSAEPQRLGGSPGAQRRRRESSVGQARRAVRELK